MNESELWPCPFCGNEHPSLAPGEQSPDCWVECPECGAHGPYSMSKDAAVKGWNIRQHSAEVQGS
jgi:Lar family restriction alleviation protein